MKNTALVRPIHILLVSIALFKMPNIYYVPFFNSQFLTTHALARIFLFMTTLHIFLFHKIKLKMNLVNCLVILLFLFQSLSVLQVININTFMSRYKEIIVGVMAYYVGFSYRSKRVIIIKTLLFSTIVSIISQLFFIIVPVYALKIYESVYYEKLFNLMKLNLSRQRTYFETFDEITIPFILFIAERLKSNLIKIGIIVLYILMFLTMVFSGWRIRFIMFIFATITSLILMRQYRILIIISFVSLILINFSPSSSTAFSRINLDEENTLSVQSRISQVFQSILILRQKPMGVGLGNYYEYVAASSNSEQNSIINKDLQILGGIANEHVHNIFGLIGVESGVVALFIFVALTVSFLINDCMVILQKNIYKTGVSLAFWTMFIYSFFNPIIGGSINFLFWFLRGLLTI